MVEEAAHPRAQCLDAEGDRPGLGQDRFAFAGQPGFAGGAAIEERQAELLLQGVDRITDRRRGAPKPPGRGGEAAFLRHRKEHQKLVDRRKAGATHIHFPEMNDQYYADFP
jgi:hypothetical protein